MKKCQTIFNILTVIAYFYGVLLCATMVLIPLGVYSIIAAHRYAEFVDYTQYQMSINKQKIKNWIIFGCILYIPFGLIGLMCLKYVDSNVVVENVVGRDITEGDVLQQDKPTVDVEIHNPQSEDEKAEKLEKLKRFKENGLITEEEFQQAKNELYGESN